ncbi:MAG: class I SAM-dependent methyltransferase [Anditalea sp.]
MKLQLYQALQYVEYYLKKEDRHSLQSPFAYRIYQGLKSYYLKNKHQFPEIEQMRNSLSLDESKLFVKDLGAGSHQFSSPERKISDIVRYSTSSKKYALLYQYFCSLTPAQTVLELGTCLGVNTCYLAEVTQGKLYTFEGADALINQAQKHIHSNKKIHVIPGNISETLPPFLKENHSIDFAFVDANHTYGHTMSYLSQLMECSHEETILVIGDIHWSKEMNRAWYQIIQSNHIRFSLDFYECGVLFFKEGLEKGHHVLHY